MSRRTVAEWLTASLNRLADCRGDKLQHFGATRFYAARHEHHVALCLTTRSLSLTEMGQKGHWLEPGAEGPAPVADSASL